MDLLLSRQRQLFSALGQAHKQGGIQAGDQTHIVSTFTGWCRRVFSTVFFFLTINPCEAVSPPLPLVEMLSRWLWKLKHTSQFQCLSDFAISNIQEPFIRFNCVFRDRVSIKISFTNWRA